MYAYPGIKDICWRSCEGFSLPEGSMYRISESSDKLSNSDAGKEERTGRGESSEAVLMNERRGQM